MGDGVRERILTKCLEDCEGVGEGATKANFTFGELCVNWHPLIFTDEDRADFGCLCWQNGKHMTDMIKRAKSHLAFQYSIREGEYFMMCFFLC